MWHPGSTAILSSLLTLILTSFTYLFSPSGLFLTPRQLPDLRPLVFSPCPIQPRQTSLQHPHLCHNPWSPGALCPRQPPTGPQPTCRDPACTTTPSPAPHLCGPHWHRPHHFRQPCTRWVWETVGEAHPLPLSILHPASPWHASSPALRHRCVHPLMCQTKQNQDLTNSISFMCEIKW